MDIDYSAIRRDILRELNQPTHKATPKSLSIEIPYTVKKMVRFLRMYCMCPSIGHKCMYTFHTKKRREAIDWLKQFGLKAEPLFYSGIVIVLTRKEFKQLTKIGDFI